MSYKDDKTVVATTGAGMSECEDLAGDPFEGPVKGIVEFIWRERRIWNPCDSSVE